MKLKMQYANYATDKKRYLNYISLYTNKEILMLK